MVADRQVGNVQSVANFYTAAQTGTLPKVSWVVPSGDLSEHPPSRISTGESFVTSLINAVMSGPDWSSTAIFVSWDDWGGFYDHVLPPSVDANGYGLRVPGLVVSPYAKQGYVDHQVLSFDAYLKFIEDDFLGGQRLDPATDGRPDARPDVRENQPILGNLVNDFNFSQAPRPPAPLPVNPTTTLTELNTALVAPSTGAYLSGTKSLSAMTTDNVTITKVEFRLVGGVLSGRLLATGSPLGSDWVASWDTTSLPDGPYSIQSVAYDSSGSVSYSVPVLIGIDNTPPATTVLVPSSGATLSGHQALDASAAGSGKVPISRVEFHLTGGALNNTLVATAGPTLYGWLAAWDSTSVPNGSYSLVSVATDAAGNTGTSSPVPVTVANRAIPRGRHPMGLSRILAQGSPGQAGQGNQSSHGARPRPTAHGPPQGAGPLATADPSATTRREGTGAGQTCPWAARTHVFAGQVENP